MKIARITTFAASLGLAAAIAGCGGQGGAEAFQTAPPTTPNPVAASSDAPAPKVVKTATGKALQTASPSPPPGGLD